MKPYVLSMQQKQQKTTQSNKQGENHMSDITNATPKGKAFTTLKIDDSTFQALFKAARAQRITVREYILSILDQHAEKLTEGK